MILCHSLLSDSIGSQLTVHSMKNDTDNGHQEDTDPNQESACHMHGTILPHDRMLPQTRHSPHTQYKLYVSFSITGSERLTIIPSFTGCPHTCWFDISCEINNGHTQSLWTLDLLTRLDMS